MSAIHSKAQRFKAVVKINILNHDGQVKATGSGAYVQNPVSGQRFVLTAAHVLQDGAAYEIVSGLRKIKVNQIKYFHNFVLSHYSKDYAITLVDARLNKRMFGVRFDDEINFNDCMHGYGLDLGAAFIDDLPGVQPYTIANSLTHDAVQDKYWAIGYGETGSGHGFGHIFSSTSVTPLPKAYNPVIQDHYYLNFTHINTGRKHVHTVLGSVFNHHIKNDNLEGQVGPGDSGGPLLKKSARGSWQVYGVICSSLPQIHTHNSQINRTWWSRIIAGAGHLAENRTQLSYLLSKESNIYGSESHFIDVTAPMVQEWFKNILKCFYKNAD